MKISVLVTNVIFVKAKLWFLSIYILALHCFTHQRKIPQLTSIFKLMTKLNVKGGVGLAYYQGGEYVK